jgi:6,7-dimethyl-8-ribityllumazine synthase
MSTKLKNLPEVKASGHFKKLSIAIVVAEWNSVITDAMMNGAIDLLISKGVKSRNISVHRVPGSFELPLGAQLCAQDKSVDAVITLGCVIQGETRHFDFICDACAHGVMNVALRFNKPVAFGVLTVDNEKQARERAGGRYGNKGAEAAESVLKMVHLQSSLNK